MNITRYGVTLNRLTSPKIELVRNWRNDKKILRHMLYREIVSEEMQQQWFDSVNNHRNFYFIIEYNYEPVGLIDMAWIDWQEKTAYAGLFIYEDKYLGTSLPVYASLTLLDIFFIIFQLETIFAKVRRGNMNAVKYNERLGFRIYQDDEQNEGQEYVLTRENYFKQADKLRKSAIHLKGNQTIIEFGEEKYSGIEFIDSKLHQVSSIDAKDLDLLIINGHPKF